LSTIPTGCLVASSCSRIEPFDHWALQGPIQRQRIALEPQQTHAAGLLTGQNALDGGGLQQRQAQQFVDNRVVQSFALGYVTAAADYSIAVVSLISSGSWL